MRIDSKLIGLSGKYGSLNIPKIAADEPASILRAQDVLAETVIRMYQLLVASHGRSMASGLDKEIQSFRKWPGSKKMPD